MYKRLSDDEFDFWLYYTLNLRKACTQPELSDLMCDVLRKEGILPPNWGFEKRIARRFLEIRAANDHNDRMIFHEPMSRSTPILMVTKDSTPWNRDGYDDDRDNVAEGRAVMRLRERTQLNNQANQIDWALEYFETNPRERVVLRRERDNLRGIIASLEDKIEIDEEVRVERNRRIRNAIRQRP